MHRLFIMIALAAVVGCSSPRKGAPLSMCHRDGFCETKTTPHQSFKQKMNEDIPAGWGRVVLQPNGWGITKEQAISDLDRVMRIYENEPGFRRYDVISIVKISKRRYQADGRCSFLAPKTSQRGS